MLEGVAESLADQCGRLVATDGKTDDVFVERIDNGNDCGTMMVGCNASATTVSGIVDPFNKYIIGYAIGRHESAALIRQAFRNAFEHVKELFGSYFKPWQVQTDNYGRGHLKCFYEAVGHWYTPAAVKNAKSKIIEPFFNQFNRQWLRLLPNSSGHGGSVRPTRGDRWHNR